MRLLRGEDLETVSREVGATAAALTRWRDAFLTAGEAALEHGVLTTERLEIERLKACLDDVLSDRDLLKKRASAKACPPQPCQADGEQSGDEAIRTRVAAEVDPVPSLCSGFQSALCLEGYSAVCRLAASRSIS
jgi:hypothetical protein